MNPLELNDIIDRIDGAFGAELPFSQQALTEEDRYALARVFGDSGYQDYLQDQVNRQIIRDYLTNALILGYITEDGLESVAEQLASESGRATLSLHMLMRSVEEAADLPLGPAPEPLKPLRPDDSSPPHFRLVRK